MKSAKVEKSTWKLGSRVWESGCQAGWPHLVELSSDQSSETLLSLSALFPVSCFKHLRPKIRKKSVGSFQVKSTPN